ncbi:MAG TPA: hypothetical protein VF533_14795 [Solirubrobacteraceae bacterium]|jgi:hypothetical protein
MKRLRRAGRPKVVACVALLAAFSWGAAVRVALADHYHTNCVGHGLVHGDSLTDGSYFSRVEAGCGSPYRRCDIYSGGAFVGSATVSGTTATCNLWSRNYPNTVECMSAARVYSQGVFADHYHNAHNWCL